MNILSNTIFCGSRFTQGVFEPMFELPFHQSVIETTTYSKTRDVKYLCGNLRWICSIMRHNIIKLLSFMKLSSIAKTKNSLRLPPADFIGLKPVFMIKTNHSSGREAGVAGNTHLSCRNNMIYKPGCWREVRA